MEITLSGPAIASKVFTSREGNLLKGKFGGCVHGRRQLIFNL